jgi:hypothetical protein
MKLILNIMLLWMGYVQQVHSQQPLKWRVDGWCEIDFTGSFGVPHLSSDSLFTDLVNAPYYDFQGNMVFYSNGIAVMDQNMDTLQNGELYYNPSFTFPQFGSNVINGTLILPKPGHSDQFFIFHSSYTEPIPPAIIAYGDLYYSIIDMNLNGGSGGITSIKNVLLKDSLWTGNINAVRHGNGRDWWLIAGKNLSDTIYTWLVTKDSIFGPYGQAKGWAFSTTGNVVFQTAFNESGDQFAIAYAYQIGLKKRLMLFDFDRCTGELTNGQMLEMIDSGMITQGTSGAQFSKSGRFLYASTGNCVYQFDMNAVSIQSSRIRVATHDYFPSPFPSGFTNMKLGPDDKIYIQTGAGNYAIDVINYPDSAGISCDVQLRQIDFNATFGSNGSNIGILPHYPNYWLGALAGSSCDTLVGINDAEDSEINLTIAPNPVIDFCTLSFPVQKQPGNLEIINALGEIVIKTTVAPGSQFKKIYLENLSSGLYFCRLKWQEKQASVRILKINE